MENRKKICVLNTNKICDECGECMRCDLDPGKTCDNCMKCVRTDAEYNAVEIDEIIESERAPQEYDGHESRIYSREHEQNDPREE